MEVARECSPRVKAPAADCVTLDVSGLGRLVGDAQAIGDTLRRKAADRGLAVHVAVAATESAARLLACGRPGLTIAPPGDERRLLADLPLSVLGLLMDSGQWSVASGRGLVAGGQEASGQRPGTRGQRGASRRPTTDHQPLTTVLRRWGLRTLGDLAALPPVALSERLGQHGVRWQRLARGEDPGPLAPDRPEKQYEASLTLEWPLEGLEPLSFVLGPLFERLCTDLERDDRAVAVLHVALTLVTHEVDTRTLDLPAPMRDPRVLRTLVLLCLERQPVTAGIDRVTVTADPAPGRIVQCSLLGRSLPLPEQIAPLVARLGALVGEERVGAAALVDSHRPEAFRMTPFSGQWAVGSGQWPVVSGQRPVAGGQRGSCDRLTTDHRSLTTVLRRFRFPVPARVLVQEGAPARVTTDRRGLEGGKVEQCAGPWSTSGEWWQLSEARLQARLDGRPVQVGWNRDEWDVALGDGGLYRIYCDRDSQRWFIDGIVD